METKNKVCEKCKNNILYYDDYQTINLQDNKIYIHDSDNKDCWEITKRALHVTIKNNKVYERVI